MTLEIMDHTSIYLSVDTISQSSWFLSGFYISLSWYDIPELVVPIRILYISQLIRYPRACGSYQDFIYLSVETISQSLWFLSGFYNLSVETIFQNLWFLSGFYISLSWNDIPELVVLIRILYISQLKRYPRACGSYQDFIYLSVETISQSLWFLSGFYISLSWNDIPELVVLIRILYISQLIRYPKACGSHQDCMYLSVDTISQSLWFLSGFYISLSWYDFQSLWFLSGFYISLSWYDIPELVVPIRILYISQLIRYSRACGSYQDFIYLSVDTISQSLWFLSGFYISLSWYDIPELVVPIRTLYISQLIRYPRTLSGSVDTISGFIYLSVETISQSLWFLSGFYLYRYDITELLCGFLSWLYISISWNDIPELVFISGFYVSLSWNDIPELVVPIRILYISQSIRYPRACGSYQDCIYLSVDMISQSVWFLSGFYLSLSSYDIPELVVPIRILYISQLIRYPRVCGFYQDFLDTGLLLARKLLNHVMLFISSNVLRSPPWLGWLIWNIFVTNDHGYIPLVVSISRSFPNSWHITVFVTRLTRRVSLVEQDQLTLP